MSTDADAPALLRSRVAAWTQAGLISPAQGDAIIAFETSDAEGTPRRLTTVAEVASYLGSVIAFAGGAAIIAPNWEDLAVYGQSALGLAIAAVALVVGTWLVGVGEAGTARLGGFLWLVGTGGLVLTVVAVVNEIDPADEAWAPTIAGAVAFTVGCVQWRNRDRPLQLLGAAGGAALAAGGLTALADASLWVTCPIVWGASLLFGVVAAAGRVQPRLIALSVAAVGMTLAPLLLIDQSERVGTVVAVASAAVVVAYALVERSWPLVTLGIVAFFIAIVTMMATVLEGMAGRLGAVAVGLFVVAAVAVRAQRTGRAGTERS